MKGVSPPDITVRQVYHAAFPFIVLELATLGLVIAIPALATWLPGFLRS